MKLARQIFIHLLILSALSQTFAQSWKEYPTVFHEPQAATYLEPLDIEPARDGGAYVVNDNTITKFDQAGVVEWNTSYFNAVGISTRSSAWLYPVFDGGPAHPHVAIAECPTGLYVAGYADFTINREDTLIFKQTLIKYDSQGHYQFSKVFDSSDICSLVCLADSNDNVYVNFGSNLMKLDSAGNLLWQLGMATTGLRFDNAGNLIALIGVNGLVKISPTGQILWNQPVPGTSVPARSSALTVGPDNSIYATFCYQDIGTQVIEKITPQGAVAWSLSNSIGAPQPVTATVPLQMVLNSNGNVYVLDGALSWMPGWRLARVSPAGTLIDTTYLPYSAALQTYADGGGSVYYEDPVWNSDGSHVVLDRYDSANSKRNSLNLSSLLATDIDSTSLKNGFIFCSSGDQAKWLGTPPPITANEKAYKLTLSGSIAWQSPVTINTRTTVGSMQGCVSPNGTTFLSEVTNALPRSPSNSQTILTAIDTNGKTVFSVPSTPGQILAEADGGCVVAGTGFEFGGNNAPAPSSVSRYSANGTLMWSVPISAKSAGFDSQGNILGLYEAVTMGYAAYKISPTGTLLWTYAPPNYWSADVVTKIDSTGSLLLGSSGETDATMNMFTLCKLSPSGALVFSRTFASSPDQQLFLAVLTAVDASGNIYLSNGRIAMYHQDGTEQWQSYVAVGVECWVSGFDSSGNAYVVGTNIANANGVIDYTARTFVGKLAAGSDQLIWSRTFQPEKFSYPIGMLFDSQGNLLIRGVSFSDTNNPGAYLLKVGSDGSLQQSEVFRSPVGVTSDYDMWRCEMLPFASYNPLDGIFGPLGGIVSLPWNESTYGVGADKNGNAYMFGTALGPDQTYETFVNKYGAPPAFDASIVQSQPSKMLVGSSASLVVTATNAGANKWTNAGGFTLNCLEPSTWGVSSVLLSITDSIAFKQSKQFFVTIKAPTTPGTYPIAWTMEKNGVPFGAQSTMTSIQVINQPNFAQFVFQTVPTAMVAGQTYPVSLQFLNTGQTTWSSSSTYDLVSVNPGKNTTWGRNRLPLINGPVGPGMTATYSGNVIAPVVAGTYNFEWQPIQETQLPYGPFSPNVAVVVTKASDAARFVSQTGVPAGILTGTLFHAMISFQNVGSSAWTVGSYVLKSRAPYNNSNWGSSTVALQANTPAGSTALFNVTFRAPSTPGTYYFQWSMMDFAKGVLFGDLPPAVTVSVMAPSDGAQFVSQTPVVASMAPGASFTVTTTLKNTGTNTWNSTYSLTSLNPFANTNWGVSALPVVGTIAPGATATFTHTFVAPSTPGYYNFAWQMSVAGVYFGDGTPDVGVGVSGDAAHFVGSVTPATVNAGSDFYTQTTMLNTGSTTWSSAAGYWLVSMDPYKNTTWGRSRNYLAGTGSYPPGAQTTIYGLCTAPLVAGTYPMQWQMNDNGSNFGELTPLKMINVVLGPDNAQYVSESGLPASFGVNHPFPFSFAMKNIGSATWDSSYTLVPISAVSFGVSSIAAPSTAPGANGTFSTTLTTPATPGQYHIQWRMKHNGVLFGQATIDTILTVT